MSLRHHGIGAEIVVAECGIAFLLTKDQYALLHFTVTKKGMRRFCGNSDKISNLGRVLVGRLFNWDAHPARGRRAVTIFGFDMCF